MAFIEPMHRNKPYITYLFTVHGSTTDHLVSLERYVRDAFARKQEAVGLFFDFPTKCCYFVVVGGLACLTDPRGYASWSFDSW